MKRINGDDYRILHIWLQLTEQEEYLGYRIERAELVVRVEVKGKRSMEALTANGQRKLSHNRWSVSGRLNLGDLAYIVAAYLLNCMGEAMLADERLNKWAGKKCTDDFGLRFTEFSAAERAFMLDKNRKLADAEYEKFAAWLSSIKPMEEEEDVDDDDAGLQAGQ